jgi:hypothetical protein
MTENTKPEESSKNEKFFIPIIRQNREILELALQRIEFLEKEELFKIDKRATALAKTNIQQGFLWLNEALLSQLDASNS